MVMTPQQLKGLNQRKPDGRFPSPEIVPDEMLRALGEMVTPALLEYGDFRSDFIAAGYTDADLCVAPKFNAATHSIKWMSEVLQWRPTAAPGEPGAWTWAPPAPSASERLATALYALSLAPHKVDGIFFPGTHACAQRVLDDVLMEHPVLMHPRLRIMAHDDSGMCSIPHAIVLACGARLPSPLDWPHGEAPVEKLTAWANHPLVRRVLGTYVSSVPCYNISPSVHGRTYLRTAVSISVRPGLLVSMHHLGLLMTPLSGAPHPEGELLGNWGRLFTLENYIPKPQVVVAPLLKSMGLSEMRLIGTAMPLTQAVLDYVRSIADPAEREKLKESFMSTIARHIMGWATSPHSAEATGQKFRLAVDSLTSAGIFNEQAQAVSSIVDATCRRARKPEIGASDALLDDTPAALGFIKAVHELGGAVTPADLCAANRADGESVEAFAPGWVEAFRIFTAESTMKSVIAREAANSHETIPTSRRRRLSV